MTDLSELSARDAVSMMRAGDVTAEQYASSLLARAQATRSLNAFITLDADRVLEQARAADRRRARNEPLGALHGLPIPVKDSVNTAEYPTTSGTPALKQFRPGADAALIAQLRREGAIVMGKTNLHELSVGYTSNNYATGAVRNPYASDRIPGGSSGGSAAVVAARGAPLSIAEDTGGSIRVPAAMCGVAGFRPTTGRYPTAGTMPMTPVYDQLGPIARHVSDLVLFDDVITGDHVPVQSPHTRGLTLAVDRGYYFAELDPETARVMQDAEQRLVDAGVKIVEISIPGLARFLAESWLAILIHDIGPCSAAFLHEWNAGVTFEEVVGGASPDVQAIFTATAGVVIPDDAYQAMLTARAHMRQEVASVLAAAGAHAMLQPMTPSPATIIGDEGPVTTANGTVTFSDFMGRNAVAGSTIGLPGLVVAAGRSRSGLPVGLELNSAAGDDRALLGVGLAVEGVLGRLPTPM